MNLSQQLKNSLNDEFFKIICLVGEKADLYGINAYIIGGVVRDLLLDKEIYDIDFVIEGNAIDFGRFLQSQNICSILKEVEDFGTIKVCFNFADNFVIDFASTRTEIYPRAGHLPVIEKIGCSLKEDILRRDFSVNALAVKVNSSGFGELIDYTEGLTDIEKKELRILHDNSFVDDPTRIIRGLRFCHKLGFELEDKTKDLRDKYLAEFNDYDICYERIKQVIKLAFNLKSKNLFAEFIDKKICKLISKKPCQVLVENLFKIIEKNKKYITDENFWFICFSIFLTKEDTLKFNLNSKEQQIIDAINDLLENKQNVQTNYDIYKLFKKIPVEAIVAFCVFDKEGYAQKYLDYLIDIKPELSGKNLIDLGFSTGKIIGELLDKILEEKLYGNIKSKEEEIIFVKQFLNL